MGKKDKALFAFGFIGILIIFCAHVYFYSGTIIDEAFISFRYARNWAQGFGPVFNHGERVEGYTNFLTVALLTLGFKFVPHFDPLHFVKLIGVLSAVGQMLLCVMMGWIVFKKNQWLGLATVYFLACDGTFHFASFNGLETQMFAFFVTSAIYFDLNEGVEKTGGGSTLFYFLSFLTRPDGVVFFALSRGFKFLRAVKVNKKLPDGFISTSIVFVFVAAAYVFAKYLFYGSFVPNTFYAKTGYESSSRFLNGIFYLLLFIRSHPVSFFFFIVFAPLYFKSSETFFLVSIFAGFTAYLIYVGGDWLQGSRFFVPLLPVFYGLIAYGLYQFYEEGVKIKSGYVKVFAFLCVAAILFTQLYASKTTYAYAMEKTRGYLRAHNPLALYLNKHLPENSTIALMDIGIVGYITNMRIVDLMGLTDSYIAHSSGGENFLKRTYPVDYIFKKNPDCIVLANAKAQGNLTGSFLIPMEEIIYASSEFKKSYRHVRTLFHRKNYYLHVFFKKKS